MDLSDECMVSSEAVSTFVPFSFHCKGIWRECVLMCALLTLMSASMYVCVCECVKGCDVV